MCLLEQRPLGAVAAPPLSAAALPDSAPCLLQAQGLSKAFGGQVVLDRVDIALRQGEVVLLRGENGTGKTTLLNILTGNLEPDSGRIHYLADHSPRSHRFPRRWWQGLNPLDHFAPELVAREGIGRTWQDVRLFGSQSLRDNIAVAAPGQPGENPILALLAPGRCSRREAEIDREADAMLARLGLAGREDSSADKISLGQSRRVAIARAAAAGARILFLDEPLAGLDRQGIANVLALLEFLVREREVVLVIIEHVFNQSHLHGLVTTDWLLAGGKLTVSDTRRAHRSLLASAAVRPGWFEVFAGADAETVDEPLSRGAFLTRVRRPGVFRSPPRAVLEIRGLVVQRGPRTVIGLDDDGDPSGLDLTLYEGEIAILQAPNGWGKSTLLDAVAGLLPAVQGEVMVNGRSVLELPIWDRARLGIRALRSARHSFPSLKVGEALSLAGIRRSDPAIGSLAERRCSTLSGGELQRVALRSTMASEAFSSLVLLDEPFSALDQETTRDLAAAVASSVRRAPVLLLQPKPF